MSDYNQVDVNQVGIKSRNVEIDQGLRIYMLKVYNYMSLGLFLTAISAFVGKTSGIYQSLAGTPFIWVLMFAPFIMVMWLSVRVHKMSATKARGLFFAFAAVMGLSLSYVFLAYTGASIATTFLVTATSFGALSLYGYTTKRDLTALGSFMFIGLVGIILASVVNWFLQSPALHFAVSIIGVLVFAGLTAYDTQAIKKMYYSADSRDVAEKKAVFGALRLYLDFINMFLFLLQIFGRRN